MSELLSAEAIQWLYSVEYDKKSHEERMALIKAAKIAYPNHDGDLSEKDRFKAILGLA